MKELKHEIDIYYLDLHESRYTDEYFIIRVPGGWIYEQRKVVVKNIGSRGATVEPTYGKEVQRGEAVFVPFSREFKK